MKSSSLAIGGSDPENEELVLFLQENLRLLGITVLTHLQVVLDLACPSAAMCLVALSPM